MKLPTAAIVGRPNVGKSTIFNRMTRTRKAITSPQSGVTRDRHVAEVVWRDRTFLAMDTGGWMPKSADLFESAIREQVEYAVEESHLILFIVDAHTGPTDVDLEIARKLQRAQRPVIVVVNKVDGPKHDSEVPLFYELGLGDPVAVSAAGGHGFADLLDLMLEKLPDAAGEESLSRPRPLVAVLGRPNVGKSSFVNAVLGRDRHLVTEIAGTTRDAIDSVITYYGQSMTLIDTAGLRRKSRVHEAVEFYTGLRANRALMECDIVVLLIDISEGLAAQDIRILQEAQEAGKGLVMCLNKWDLVDKDHMTADREIRQIDQRLPALAHVPKLLISCKEKTRIFRVLETVLKVYEECGKRIATSELNRFIEQLMAYSPPPAIKGKDVRFLYAVQPEVNPPVFSFWSKYPELMTENYRRFLERKLREKYGYRGVPLKLVFRSKSRLPAE